MKSNLPRMAVLPLTACYFALHYLQHTGAGPAAVRYYGKDLLLVPMLTLATAIAAELTGRPQKIGTKEIALTFAAVSVFFEGLLPLYSEDVSGDPYDIAAYAVGALFTALAVRSNKKLRHSVWTDSNPSK